MFYDQEKVIIESGNTVSTTQTGKNQKRREVFCTRSILDFWKKLETLDQFLLSNNLQRGMWKRINAFLF